MDELSYIKMKTANEARLADEARVEMLKRNIMILVLHHLQDHGYVDSCVALEEECGISLAKYSVADNVDLISIVQEYEAYYQIKFGKPPRLIKKSSTGDGQSHHKKGRKSRRSNASQRSSNKNTGMFPRLHSADENQKEDPANRSKSAPNTNKQLVDPISSQDVPPKLQQRKGGLGKNSVPSTSNFSSNPTSSSSKLKSRGRHPNGVDVGENAMGMGMNLSGQGLQPPPTKVDRNFESSKSFVPPSIIDVRAQLQNAIINNSYDHHEDKLLKPLGNFGNGYDGQMKELANVIGRDIYLRNPNVRWADIIGLGDALRLVKEAVVYPIRYPQLFQGILSPWKGLLLYGPPGTGKTMLAKAIATECRTTFFNISASSIVSKWRGDSEKLVRVLFELARFHAPSTIFLDELDSIMSVRSGSSDHEGSRRMKTELLMQMDGLNKSNDLVFVLGASNLPWELDAAMLRRLEKRILVDLPTEEAREAMFRHHLPPQVLEKEENGISLTAHIDYSLASKQTPGYSGSDIHLVCKEAAMKPVRQVFDILEGLEEEEGNVTESLRKINLREVTTDDVLQAIQSTKPSASGLQKKYREWQDQFESS
eukprot:m.73352 g.73352  ORF g.73352 m.73352 type:complete len:595 (+) comp8418_c0_seq5:101-1885(+)